MFPIPTVQTAQEIVDKALRRAAKASGTGQTKLERARRAGVAKMQALGDTIDATLRSYVEAVPSLEKLPEFQRELVEVLVGVGNVKHNLGAIDWCREQVLRISRQAGRELGRAASPSEALRLRKAAYGRVASLLKRIGPNLAEFSAARKKLIRVPDFDPELPTIVVAGYPNVGKSQFVRVVSTGKPKVAPYPFTTQGLSVGHFDRGWRRYLVVDTPGLLDRPMEKRNEVERQGIVALRHLADAIVFLFDPSETCGYPIAVQENLLQEVREAFPTVPIVEVENKADLIRTGSRRRKVCALSGEGCEEIVDIALAAMKGVSAPQGPANHRQAAR